VLPHSGVEGFFSGVAEWGMPDVMHQGQSLGEVVVESELRGDGTRNLRDFDGVGEAVAKMIGVAACEDLGLRFQPSEGAGVDDAVAVTLKVVAVEVMALGMPTSAGVFYMDGVVGEL
jgi:hypothetical protein